MITVSEFCLIKLLPCILFEKKNKEDAMDRCKWRKMIKDVRSSGWVWVGECFFWYRPTRVVPDKRPLNGCVCVCVYFIWKIYFYFSVENGQPREPALCQLNRQTYFVPCGFECRSWPISRCTNLSHLLLYSLYCAVYWSEWWWYCNHTATSADIAHLWPLRTCAI